MDSNTPDKAMVDQTDENNNAENNQGSTQDIQILTESKTRFEDAPVQLKEVNNYLKNLEAPERLNKYVGLSNQGATCYMNCLL